MKILNGLYKAWVWLCFVMFFFILFPFFVLFVQRESWKPAGHFLNKIWAYAVFGFCFLPTRVEYRFKPRKNTTYIYCANHTSYLDIPSLCYALSGYNVFIGKASLAKVPLFGYMFRNLYIAVDRSSPRSKQQSIIRAMEEIDKGRGLIIFPEGTIPKENHPNMIPFKDGAFRIAIEKKVPIVPVTILDNWKILPDDGKFLPKRQPMRMVIHEPIETHEYTLEQTGVLKQKTFDVIYQELKKHYPERVI
ncbi:MAG: 1-acyl-sn-glycerol-3-phosphate acyltransferase [Cytophagaceae bacterium]|nr:1-acyl-sn-glycerol-3-phosphate acyltransferase [Cytophagaceae bacterium]MDW8456113.1 lysophospholipid acyltransferase family protein [Cytophagaceae bacterium]